MHLLQTPSIWFLCGSQHLYGPGPLRTVAQNAGVVAKALDASAQVPLPVVFKGLLTTPEEIRATLLAANGDADCAGVDPVDAHVLAVADVDRRAAPRCRSRSCTCTRSSTARRRGIASTWIS